MQVSDTALIMRTLVAIASASKVTLPGGLTDKLTKRADELEKQATKIRSFGIGRRSPFATRKPPGAPVKAPEVQAPAAKAPEAKAPNVK
jgi:hypothetical protein